MYSIIQNIFDSFYDAKYISIKSIDCYTIFSTINWSYETNPEIPNILLHTIYIPLSVKYLLYNILNITIYW